MSEPSKNSGYTPVGTILQHVAGRLLAQPRSQAQKLCWAWSQSAGEQVAQHSEPTRLTNGVLTVRVDSPVWNSQLHHLKAELLAKMQSHLPPGSLREIRFRQGSLRSLPAWLLPKPSPPPLPAPCAEDEQEAAHRVAQVSDPELREVLRRLVLTHLTRVRNEACRE
ncbi:MAG: DUF721 domain-containing protein [Magnetococcales bacterium]|nr:DUF721 domain-containing protein [Magnetococcales bacterium]